MTSIIRIRYRTSQDKVIYSLIVYESVGTRIQGTSSSDLNSISVPKCSVVSFMSRIIIIIVIVILLLSLYYYYHYYYYYYYHYYYDSPS